MSPLDPPPPPAGEEIHLPGPSLLPLLMTAGIALAVVGITLSLIFVIAGGLLTLVCLIRWIGETRHEIDELPS
ncbi:MAG TPA: hypothetical protein VID29_05550 [Solirubrobacteraceae bacterium]|jgi:hypothetical protein